MPTVGTCGSRRPDDTLEPSSAGFMAGPGGFGIITPTDGAAGSWALDTVGSTGIVV